MKKTLTIFSLIFLMSFIATAQDSLYIYKTGTIVTRRAVADIDSILFKSFGALKAPEGLSATAANGQIALSWNTVSSATSYNIYRSTIQGVTKTNGTKISNVVGFPYTNTSTLNGTKYYYVITAVNSSGESGESAEVNATSFVPADTGWGGTATLNVINGVTYAVHTFNYNAIFYPPGNLTHARVLLVGSGGTGGGTDPLATTAAIGGGGGGGEVRDVDVVITDSSMSVVISTDAGSVTSFGNQTVTNGSSGVAGTTRVGGTSGNGIAGGIGFGGAGGGGGGATGHGTDGIPDNWNPMGGNGGDGIMCNISGTTMYYGGGGGGGAWTGYDGKPGTGGAGGGGGGWGVKGVANTGGGGSGASYSNGGGGFSSTLGSLGGSGVVIISYQL